MTYHVSDMILGIHSNAGCLNEEYAQNRQGGHHFMSKNVLYSTNNGAMHNKASIIKAVMSSAAEAKMGVLYTNARKGWRYKIFWRRWAPTALHPHPNRQLDGRWHNKLKNYPNCTKAMDMRFHWLCDQSMNQRQLRFYWRPGSLLWGDYYTKHHSLAHHRNTRREILTLYKVVMVLREKLQKISNARKSTMTQHG